MPETSPLRVAADRDACCASGLCVVAAPDVFDQDESDGLVVVRTPEVAEAEQDAVREAAAGCPSGAITVLD